MNTRNAVFFSSCSKKSAAGDQETKTTLKVSWGVVVLTAAILAALLIKAGLVDREDLTPVLSAPSAATSAVGP